MKHKMTLTAVAMLILSTLACGLFSGGAQPATEAAPPNAPQAQAPTTAPPKVAPTATTASPVGGDECIVGDWSLSDFEQYMSSVLPPEITSSGELTYQGTTGSAVYSFSADHAASIQASQFTVSYQMNMAGLNIPLEVVLDGFGAANYTTDGDQVMFSNVNSDNIFMTINLGGTPAMPATPITGVFPGSDTNSSLTYTCTSSSLTLTMPVEGSAPVVLERTSP